MKARLKQSTGTLPQEASLAEELAAMRRQISELQASQVEYEQLRQVLRESGLEPSPSVGEEPRPGQPTLPAPAFPGGQARGAQAGVAAPRPDPAPSRIPGTGAGRDRDGPGDGLTASPKPKLSEVIRELLQTEEVLRQRNRELEMFSRASQVFLSTLSLDQVLASVLEEVRNLLGVIACSIWLIDPETNELVCRHATGPKNEMVRGWRLGPGQGVVGWVAHSRQSLVVPDTQADERHFVAVDRHTGLEIRSILSVPLQIKGNVIGVIQVLDTQIGRFTVSDLNLIEPVAVSASIAIENARLYDALYRRNRELTMLNQIIAAAALGLEPEAILETACRELALTFRLPQAAAALLNEKKSQAIVVAEYLAEDRPSLLSQIIPVADNPPLEAILNNKAPLVINSTGGLGSDVARDSRLKPGQGWLPDGCPVASLLILPLTSEGEIIGGLGLATSEPGRFSAEDISLAWSVANQAGAALAQARLREQRQRLEEQYHQSQKMEAIGRLTAGIAHDFNNLLTAINGFSQLMRFELTEEDPRRDMVDRIWDSGRRASDLIRQLLVFSSKQVVELQALDLNQVVAGMDKLLRRIIGEDIELKAILTPELWPVKADRAQIEQVIVNLAVNARDAMPSGGRLTIEINNTVLDAGYAASHLEATPGEYVLLAVSDTGIGMSEQIKARIFEPFFTTKEPGKGTGLGLATVYSIVKQSGGHIWVYSEEGLGSAFKIYLPRTQEQVQAVVPQRVISDMPAGDETILLVEDDEAVRELSQRVLQGRGYLVLEARNGQEALLVSTHHPGPIHLLLTDVVMPGISGPALAEQLSAARPTMRILFMSGYTDEAIVHHGVLSAGAAFLQKPFSPMALADKVRQALDAS